MKPPPAKPAPGEPLYLVQCCHLPQFFFAAEQLRRDRPGRLNAVVLDHPRVRELLQKFPLFEAVHFLDPRRGEWSPAAPPGSEERPLELLFPLLTRGHRQLKRAAAALPHRRLWELDYRGRVTPLTQRRLRRSHWLAQHSATAEFARYLQRFPRRVLEGRILVLHSADETLIESSRESWEARLADDVQTRHVRGIPSRRERRHLREWRPDGAVIFLSGETGYGKLKRLPLRLRLRNLLGVNENGDTFLLEGRSLARFLYQRLRHGVTRPQSRIGIVFVQTESRRQCEHALRTLRQEQLYPDAELTVLCPEMERPHFESQPEVDRVIARGPSLRDTWRAYREALQTSPDIVSAVFSGRPGFRTGKLLVALLSDRKILAFNAALDAFQVTARTAHNLLRSGIPRYAETRVLFVQTEGRRQCERALRRLRSLELYPRCEITVLCPEGERDFFKSLPTVDKVIGHGHGLSEAWKAARRASKFRPEVVSAVFSGRPVFRRHKLLTLLLGRGRIVAFNAGLDAYRLTPRTAHLPFRREPLLYPEEDPVGAALMVQTESEEVTTEAIRVLASDKVSGGKTVSVFCTGPSADHFRSLPEVRQVFAYQPGIWLENLRLLIRVWRSDRDIVAAIYSGRPIFRVHKLLPMLLPAGDRLAFNENLDCFYLGRSRIKALLALLGRLSVARRRGSSRLAGWLLVACRGVLYVPRFLFLAGWLNWEKLRRAQRRGPERTAASSPKFQP